jgi:uncharacterized protein with GYD domain
MPDGAAFVFMPEKDAGIVGKYQKGGMPRGVRYVASVTGPWQVFAVVEFDDVSELPGIVGTLASDPPTALVFGPASVRRTEYRELTALVRIDVKDDADLDRVAAEIRDTAHTDEVDTVMGDFDLLACVGGRDEAELRANIFAIRAVGGVRRTVTLRVIDYVSTSEDAPPEKKPQS